LRLYLVDARSADEVWQLWGAGQLGMVALAKERLATSTGGTKPQPVEKIPQADRGNA